MPIKTHSKFARWKSCRSSEELTEVHHGASLPGPDCGGRLRLVATIEDTSARGFRSAERAVVEKILTHVRRTRPPEPCGGWKPLECGHLGLPVDPPCPSPARTPAWLPGVRRAADHEHDAGGHWAD